MMILKTSTSDLVPLRMKDNTADRDRNILQSKSDLFLVMEYLVSSNWKKGYPAISIFNTYFVMNWYIVVLLTASGQKISALRKWENFYELIMKKVLLSLVVTQLVWREANGKPFYLHIQIFMH